MTDFASVTVERGVPGRMDRPGCALRFPFNQAVINGLKQLPQSDRYWTGSYWWCAAEREQEAIAVLFEHYAEILFYGMGGESDYVMDRHGAVIEQGGLFD